ncbi:hypothetical protein LTWDN19_00530 [Latilactobacillus curvatus]|uniref:Uncharacterized protein n=1 Tax=Latilactobacillus curvatus TaxID=28038 RepID=A0ABN6GF83_LATCU|nr:hypothetical protein LTWDN19_00530 [Latilactobacillus curvatus]
MKQNKKTFLLKLLVRMLGKGNLYNCGVYQPYELINKYDKKSDRLPRKYKVLIIPDDRQDD